MKSMFVLPAAVFVFAVGTIVYLQSAQQDSNKPFVVTYAKYYQGRPDSIETWVDLVNSRGVRFSKRLDLNGKDAEHFPPQATPQGWWNRGGLLRSPAVVGQSQVLGLTTYIMRHYSEGQVIEEWYAEETGPVPLKQIIQRGNGDTLIVEAVKIEFRPVSDQEMTPRAELLRKSPE